MSAKRVPGNHDISSTVKKYPVAVLAYPGVKIVPAHSFNFLWGQYSPMTIMLSGTAGRNQIPTHGGFNFSEFNIQKHTHPRTEHSTFSEQDRGHQKYAGRDPLTPPSSSTQNIKRSGLNKAYGWREPTLTLPVPAQVETLTSEQTALRKVQFAGSDRSVLARSFRHGFGQNDPVLQHLISENQIAPKPLQEFLADPYVHSDVGVPSVANQNLLQTPTYTRFPMSAKEHYRGRHDHLSLKHERTPALRSNAHTATGAHHTHAIPTHPVTNGFRATRGPLERPLLLSDLPPAPQPQIRPEDWPGMAEPTQNRAVFLIA